jgi:hypothetical protein
MRTFHHHFQVIYQATDDLKGLSDGILRLLEGESIQPLEDLFDFILSEEFFGIFFCSIRVLTSS